MSFRIGSFITTSWIINKELNGQKNLKKRIFVPIPEMSSGLKSRRDWSSSFKKSKNSGSFCCNFSNDSLCCWAFELRTVSPCFLKIYRILYLLYFSVAHHDRLKREISIFDHSTSNNLISKKSLPFIFHGLIWLKSDLRLDKCRIF